jgi:hypothetical protein
VVENIHAIEEGMQPFSVEKQLPFATMTFHLNTTVYRKQGDKLVKADNERIAIGDVEPVIALHEEGNVAELIGGRFVKDVLHQNPTIYYGILEVIGAEANVCSRNGIVQRKLCRNQSFKVKNVKELDSGTFIYGIGKTNTFLL